MFQKLVFRRISDIASAVFLISSFLACSVRVEEEKSAVNDANKFGTSESIVETGLEMLDSWTSYWADLGMPNSGSAFEPSDVRNIELLERPEVNPIKEAEHPLGSFQFHHPNDKGTVDIYHYKLHIDSDDGVSFEPDAEVIFYRESGMRERLLFMGPSGLFEDAVWIDDNHLVVVGYFEKETGFSPMVWLIDIEQYNYQLYESEFVIASLDRYGYLKSKLSPLNFKP
jgi:hypothetical protein